MNNNNNKKVADAVSNNISIEKKTHNDVHHLHNNTAAHTRTYMLWCCHKLGFGCDTFQLAIRIFTQYMHNSATITLKPRRIVLAASLVISVKYTECRTDTAHAMSDIALFYRLSKANLVHAEMCVLTLAYKALATTSPATVIMFAVEKLTHTGNSTPTTLYTYVRLLAMETLSTLHMTTTTTTHGPTASVLWCEGGNQMHVGATVCGARVMLRAWARATTWEQTLCMSISRRTLSSELMSGRELCCGWFTVDDEKQRCMCNYELGKSTVIPLQCGGVVCS